MEELPLKQHVLAKTVVGIFVLGAVVYWYQSVFLMDKVDYNTNNAYFGFIPLLAYIYFRNISVYLR